MKIVPRHTVKNDPLETLDPLQRKCYNTAVTVAFISVFMWVVKILFL